MKYIFVLFLSMFFASNTASADIFELHFHYDAQTNRLDFLDNQNAVSINKDKDISIVDFSESVSEGSFEFTFLDSNGDELATKQFMPQQGDFVMEVPYFSIATKLIIRKTGSSEAILTQDLTALSTCNNNQICEFEKGETINTCLPDCASGNVTYSPETKVKVDAAGGVVRDEKTGDILLNDVKPEPTPQDTSQTPTDQSKKSPLVSIALLVAGILMLAGVAVYFIRRRR